MCRVISASDADAARRSCRSITDVSGGSSPGFCITASVSVRAALISASAATPPPHDESTPVPRPFAGPFGSATGHLSDRPLDAGDYLLAHLLGFELMPRLAKALK